MGVEAKLCDRVILRGVLQVMLSLTESLVYRADYAHPLAGEAMQLARNSLKLSEEIDEICNESTPST